MDQLVIKNTKDHAIKLLSLRPQSENELRNKLDNFLYKKGVSKREEYVNTVIENLINKNLVNDKLFARWYIGERADFKPRSIRTLRQELKIKKISDDIIEQELETYDELEACKKVAKKKKGYERKKLIQYLLRQGFPWDVVQEVIELIVY